MVFVCSTCHELLVCGVCLSSTCHVLFLPCTAHKQKARDLAKLELQLLTRRQQVCSKEKSQAAEQCQPASSGSSSQMLRTAKRGEWWERPAAGFEYCWSRTWADPPRILRTFPGHYIASRKEKQIYSSSGRQSSPRVETLASCQSEPNDIMRANSTNSSYFSCAPHCRLKAHSEKVLCKDGFYFDKALCFNKATRGASEGEDGGGARLAGSCSPAAGAGSALARGKRCRRPLKRRIPCLDPSCAPRWEHRGLGRPGKGGARGLLTICYAEPSCPVAWSTLNFTPMSAVAGLLCTCAGKHKGDRSLKTHPVSLARGKMHAVPCGCLNLPCFSLFLLGSMFGMCIYLARLDWCGAEGKIRQPRAVETRSVSMSSSTHTVSASCKSPWDFSYT